MNHKHNFKISNTRTTSITSIWTKLQHHMLLKMTPLSNHLSNPITTILNTIPSPFNTPSTPFSTTTQHNHPITPQHPFSTHHHRYSPSLNTITSTPLQHPSLYHHSTQSPHHLSTPFQYPSLPLLSTIIPSPPNTNAIVTYHHTPRHSRLSLLITISSITTHFQHHFIPFTVSPRHHHRYISFITISITTVS